MTNISETSAENAGYEALTRSQAVERINAIGASNGGIGRGSFQSGTPCLVGSMDPTIDSNSKCPSHVMPQWMFEAVIAINDGIEIGRHKEWAGGFVDSEWQPGAYAKALALYPDDKDIPERVLHRFVMEHVLSIARESFDHAQWADVLAAIGDKIELCRRYLAGDLPTEKEWADNKERAAGAAEAAWAAWAAEAAEAAEAAGAIRAARAAEAARATWAAGAAEAAEAAEAAAYTRMGFGLVQIMIEEAPIPTGDPQ